VGNLNSSWRKLRSVMESELMVRFDCPKCMERLMSPARMRGQRRTCPNCSTKIEVPSRSQRPAVKPVAKPEAPVVTVVPVATPVPVVKLVQVPVATPAKKEKPTVPFELALPNNMGGVKARVSQPTADSMFKVVVGGFLVALGVIVAAMLGLRRPSA
jgi:hypothetical protein